MNINVSNLSFNYGKHPVLDAIDLTAREGELLSIVGPNGVGKSTLFYCILGLLNHYSGQISIGGHDTRELGIKDMASLIAYIPQSHFPSFNFSVFDMVMMGTTHQFSSIAMPGPRQKKMVEAALERLGIAHLRDRGYSQISGGERQLVLIARALVQETKVLILDEPTANLDFGNQILVLTQIRSLTREGYTIIQSTHNPEQTFQFSDSVAALLGGRVIAHGSPAQIFTEELMKELYGVEINVQSLFDDKVRVCIPKAVIENERRTPEFASVPVWEDSDLTEIPDSVPADMPR